MSTWPPFWELRHGVTKGPPWWCVRRGFNMEVTHSAFRRKKNLWTYLLGVTYSNHSQKKSGLSVFSFRVQNCAVSFELFLILGCKWKQMRSKLKFPRGGRKRWFWIPPMVFLIQGEFCGLSHGWWWDPLYLKPSICVAMITPKEPWNKIQQKLIHASLSIPKTNRNGFPFSTVAHKDDVGGKFCVFKLSSDPWLFGAY